MKKNPIVISKDERECLRRRGEAAKAAAELKAGLKALRKLAMRTARKAVSACDWDDARGWDMVGEKAVRKFSIPSSDRAGRLYSWTDAAANLEILIREL